VDLASGRPVEAAFARYENGTSSHQTPGALGGHNWQPMAFSPATGLVYIPAQVAQGSYADPDSFTFLPGAWNTGMRKGGKNKTSEPEPRGELIAWDPVAGKARWRVGFTEPWRSGVLATAGGLVFHAAGHQFQAFDAATGERLWTYDTGANPIAPAASYEIDGQQYVALMVGYGGAGGMGGDQPRRKGRLLVFRLGGAVTPKPYPKVVAPAPLDLAAAEPSKGDPTRGETTYRQLCSACHGGGVFLPHLPRSPAILNEAGFRAIVLDGALKDRGMAPFKRFLAPWQVEDVRAYLLTKAKDDAAPKPTTAHAQ
jgi:quinohemoprotein ethanol dehydrogenase